MTEQPSCVVVLDVVAKEYSAGLYWVKDDTLPEAKARFKRLTGKFPSKNAKIHAFKGSMEDLDSIVITEFGDIICPKSLTRIVVQ